MLEPLHGKRWTCAVAQADAPALREQAPRYAPRIERACSDWSQNGGRKTTVLSFRLTGGVTLCCAWAMGRQPLLHHAPKDTQRHAALNALIAMKVGAQAFGADSTH